MHKEQTSLEVYLTVFIYHNKIFYIDQSGEIIRYDLSIPNDFRTAKYIQEIDIAADTKTLGFSIVMTFERLVWIWFA